MPRHLGFMISIGIILVFMLLQARAGEESDERVDYYNYHEPIGELPCLKHGSRCNVIHNEAIAACCNSNPIYPPCYDFKFIVGQCRWVMCRYPNGQNTYLKYCLHWNYFKYNFKWTGDSHRSGGRIESYDKQINPTGAQDQANRHSELQKQIAEQHKNMNLKNINVDDRFNEIMGSAPRERGLSNDHDLYQQQIAEQLKRIEEAI